MQTECIAERFDFGVVEGRAVEAGFDAGMVTSDAGGLLLGATVATAERPDKALTLDWGKFMYALQSI